MPWHTLKPLVLLGLIGLLAACAGEEIQRGYIFNPSNLAKIKAGESTQSDVLQTLGSPSLRSDFEVERWHYIGDKTRKFSVLDPTVEEHDVVTVEFDGEGKVGKIERQNVTDMNDIDVVTRETPSEGNRFSAIEQLVGNFGKFNKANRDAAAVPGAPGTR
jgi:outer membrane protein assembly factor BamE (lipoprotein component of BamABCDE complex)